MKTRPHPSEGRTAPTGFGEYRVCPIVETADFGKGNLCSRAVFQNRLPEKMNRSRQTGVNPTDHRSPASRPNFGNRQAGAIEEEP
jgi:hypothetical protein